MPNAPVLLTVVIGVLMGIGVTYVALRPEADSGSSVFDGPSSVKTIDHPAGAPTGAAVSSEEILANATFAASNVVTPAAEPSSARSALTEFLNAELADRSDVSFALLSAELQRDFGSVAAWRQSRSERVVPERFTVISERATEGGGRVEVTVGAERRPAISLFRGLVAAHATERWTLERTTETGWRLRRPTATVTEPRLPPDAGARTIAQQWVELAASCAAADALTPFQLTPDLLGAVDLSGLACEAGGRWSTTAEAVPVAELPDVTTFVAAFGSSVGRWGRGVAVSNGTQEMTVVLGPVGADWRVMGLTAR